MKEPQRSDESVSGGLRMKDEMCGGEGHRRGRRAGQKIERLVLGE